MGNFAIQLPKNERGISEDDARRFDRLNTRLARKDLRKNQREDAEQELANLIAKAERTREAEEVEAGLHETADLAEQRGERVKRQRSGALRITNRNPLRSLLEAGNLSAAQFDAGEMMRKLYELRAVDLGSQLQSLVTGAAHDNDRFVFARLQRSKKLLKLYRIERQVALECRAEPAALQMLRAVCGDGVSLRVFGAGRAWARHLNALCLALDVVAGEKPNTTT